MAPPRLFPRARAALVALVLGAAATSCGAAPAPPSSPSLHSPCEGPLDACERRIVKDRSAGELRRDLVAAYVAARAAKDASDPWARVFRALDAHPGTPSARPAVALLVEPGARAEEVARASAPRKGLVIPCGALPKTEGIAEAELLLAMGEVTSQDLLVRVSAASVTQLFPGDPVAPFTAGILPVLRADDTLGHLAEDAAMAASVRDALGEAGAFHYVEAARAALLLGALVDAGNEVREPVLRASYALMLLGGAGIVLDAEASPAAPPAAAASAPATATTGSARTPPPPSPTDSPYGDLLRARMAKDWRATWEGRRTNILSAVAEDRRDDLDAFFAKTSDCAAQTRPPPMEGPRDLIYGGRLSAELAASGDPNATGLPITEWLRRYDTFARIVERTHTAWQILPTLLYQRGEAQGLSPAGTSAYKRVTELGQQHLMALDQLRRASPARFQELSLVSLAFCPGLLGDDGLREPLILLSQVTLQDKLARAKDASAVLESAFTGVLAGMSYPPALQSAHYLALEGAFAAKLHGDLLTQTGWEVAGLYAADGILRVMNDQPGKVGFSTDQIARALSAPGVEMPALAALATSAARYAALAATHKLSPAILKLEHFPADRRAARDALRAAIAGLGEPGEAPNNVLDDVTQLADGLIATLSTSLGAPSKPIPPGACPTKVESELAPETRRALDKLGDVRRRILGHPRFKNGDGPWVRRTRLLVTFLSDAMDLALHKKGQFTFAVPGAEGEKTVADALREWSERGAADGLAAAYGLARAGLAAKTPEAFLEHNGPGLRRVLRGVLGYFHSDPATSGTMGMTLLDALATMPLSDQGEDLTGLLLGYARGFYERKEQDRGDLWLLASLTADAITHSMPRPEALELAAANRSRLGWAMRFLSEVGRAGRADAFPDPSVYADDMRRATDDSCAKIDVEPILAVTQARRDFEGGKRKEARAALDRVLEKADEKGLGVPRMLYKYEEKTATKVFSLTLDISYANGFLESANTFQIGLGVRTSGEPEGSMTAKLSADGQKSGEDAARYYVRTAAVAATYNFLDGDLDHAIADARRAVSALIGGVRLGPRSLRTEKPGDWAQDARVALAMDAELAAEAGMPLLAGDLWTVVRPTLGDSLDDKGVAALLDAPSPTSAMAKELAPIVSRTAKALKVLAAPLPCTDAKVELGAFEEPTCEAYPLALSLRVADVLKKLPRLKKGSEPGPHCAALRSLDAFLAAAEKGTYEPDLFTRAVEELTADGRVYDAAVLLTRQKRPEHCSPAILGAARRLGRSPLLGPLMRSDLLASAINCTASSVDAAVLDDLVSLDAETRRLPDLSRNLKVVLTVADLAAHTDRWELLGKLTTQPDFLDRWMGWNPNAAAAGLLLWQAAEVLGNRPSSPGADAPGLASTERTERMERSRGAYELLCEAFAPGERAEICALIKGLRQPGRTDDERRRLARDGVKTLLSAAQAPPAATPRKP